MTPDVQTTSCCVVFLYDFHPWHKAGDPHIVMTMLLINKENNMSYGATVRASAAIKYMHVATSCLN